MTQQFYFKQFYLVYLICLHFVEMSSSSIWSIDRALSGATTPCQNGPGSNGNEGVLPVPQISSFTGTSPADCFMSYPERSLEGSYSSAKMQSVYSAAPADLVDLPTNKIRQKTSVGIYMSDGFCIHVKMIYHWIFFFVFYWISQCRYAL